MQNESVDDELEHFEDIVEETDNEPHTAGKTENNLAFVHKGDKNNLASDISEEEEGDSPVPSSDDDDSDEEEEEEEELFGKDGSKELKEIQKPSNHNGNQRKISSTGPFLPGGYDPRHREPSYCNADRSSWWELMVLASHVHPSVATMAGTLLSGANIVYNGNPLNDLNLTAFLDKFMEKKPKQTTWHGGSQIEPAKKLDMNSHLIGSEILSLAEVDVPPEDFVFHKFYVNKMNSSKPKKKKKKKAADEEAAEELFDVGGDDEIEGADESDNEEIENLLDSAGFSLEADGEYDYDDLDRVANEEDDDLIDNASDVDMALPSVTEEDFDSIANGDISDGDDEAVVTGDVDDDSDGLDGFDNRKRKRKSGGKAGASPFASVEDYEHLLKDESPTKKEKKSTKKKTKSRKKRKSE